jgi:hypothetical protein
VPAWIKRFGLHLAAAVGATSVFVAAAAVGANQTRQVASISPPPTTIIARPPRTATVRPERSLAGTVRAVQPDYVEVTGVGGRVWRVEPAPGALIRVNGKAASLDGIQAGDGVVILGQAEGGPGLRFLAHAITAKSR